MATLFGFSLELAFGLDLSSFCEAPRISGWNLSRFPSTGQASDEEKNGKLTYRGGDFSAPVGDSQRHDAMLKRPRSRGARSMLRISTGSILGCIPRRVARTLHEFAIGLEWQSERRCLALAPSRLGEPENGDRRKRRKGRSEDAHRCTLRLR